MKRLLYVLVVLSGFTIAIMWRGTPSSPTASQAVAVAASEGSEHLSLEVGQVTGSEATIVIVAHIAQPVRTCSLVLSYDPDALTIEDADPGETGIQIELPNWIVPQEVRRNEVAPGGRFYLSLQGEPLFTGEHPVVLGLIRTQLHASTSPTMAVSGLYVEDPQGAAFYVHVDQPPDHPLVIETEQAEVPSATELPVQTTLEPLHTSVPEGPSPTPLLPTPTPPPAQPEPAATPSPPPTPLPAAIVQVSPDDLCPPLPAAWQDGIYLRLLPGQTLYGVARAFDTTVEALMLANGITDVSTIPAETILFVPVPPPEGRGNTAYYVAPYDTLRSIADDFNLPVEVLICRNGDVLADGLQAGEWLRLRP